MIRAVLDTNVLASGMVGLSKLGSTPSEVLRRLILGEFAGATSEAILTEVERTFEKEFFLKSIGAISRDDLIDVLRLENSVTEIWTTVNGVATHPEDDLVLATAVSASADYLVTGDKQLRALGAYQPVRIVSPRDFLDVLDRQKLGG